MIPLFKTFQQSKCLSGILVLITEYQNLKFTNNVNNQRFALKETISKGVCKKHSLNKLALACKSADSRINKRASIRENSIKS